MHQPIVHRATEQSRYARLVKQRFTERIPRETANRGACDNADRSTRGIKRINGGKRITHVARDTANTMIAIPDVGEPYAAVLAFDSPQPPARVAVPVARP